MGEDIKDKVSGWILPILGAVIGFFLVQTYTTVQDISAKMNLYALDVAAVKSEQIRIKEDIMELKAYKISNEAWIRKWLEENQGAIDYIKVQAKKENR